MSPAAARVEVGPEELDRLNQLRERANALYRAALAAGPDPRIDPVGAVAWVAGVRSPVASPNTGKGYIWNEDQRAIINAARAAGASWLEITRALGRGAGDVDATRAEQHWRNRKYAEAEADVHPVGEAPDDDYGDIDPDDPGSGGIPSQ